LLRHQAQGQALTIWAHTWARAVDSRLQRDTVVEKEKFFPSGSSAGEPAASLDTQGISLHEPSWNNP
jgi:hypothetical protein